MPVSSATRPRSTPVTAACAATWTVLGERARAFGSDSACWTTSAAVAPPNAAESFNAARSGRGSARSQRTTRASGSGAASPQVGGTTPLSMASAAASISSTPAAPRVWPICALKACTGGEPHSDVTARDSAASL
jgi:hypothetical protein